MQTSQKTPTQRELARAERRRSTRINLIWLAGLVLFLGAAVFFSFRNRDTVRIKSPAIGVEMSDFTRTDINGKEVSLSDYEGQVVFMTTWALWCPPCREEMPDLETYYQMHAAEGFVVLSVDAGDNSADVADFAAENNLTFPMLLDPNEILISGLKIDSFPTSYLIDRQGVIAAIHIGMLTLEEIQTLIDPVLAN